jgi:predicted HAD superfamily Cof-like phosphohydrolase
MGRVKELFMQMYYANNESIPKEATIADLKRMEDLKVFEWREYERASQRAEEKFKIEQNNLQIEAEAAERESLQKEMIKQYPKK